MDAEAIGPTSAVPALQVRATEDLIAKGVDVISVVQNDKTALEPVLKRAMEAGIKVVAHEGPGLTNVDGNFEPASLDGLGEAHAKFVAEKIGGPDDYAVHVGSLTVPLHNGWAAIAWTAENYPEIQLIEKRFGVAESVDDSRATALDLIAANAGLKGSLAFGSREPIGTGRAVEMRRKTGETHVLGVLAGAGQASDEGRTEIRRLHVNSCGGGMRLRVWRQPGRCQQREGQHRAHAGNRSRVDGTDGRNRRPDAGKHREGSRVQRATRAGARCTGLGGVRLGDGKGPVPG